MQGVEWQTGRQAGRQTDRQAQAQASPSVHPVLGTPWSMASHTSRAKESAKAARQRELQKIKARQQAAASAWKESLNDINLEQEGCAHCQQVVEGEELIPMPHEHPSKCTARIHKSCLAHWIAEYPKRPRVLHLKCRQCNNRLSGCPDIPLLPRLCCSRIDGGICFKKQLHDGPCERASEERVMQVDAEKRKRKEAIATVKATVQKAVAEVEQQRAEQQRVNDDDAPVADGGYMCTSTAASSNQEEDGEDEQAQEGGEEVPFETDANPPRYTAPEVDPATIDDGGGVTEEGVSVGGKRKWKELCATTPSQSPSLSPSPSPQSPSPPMARHSS